MRVGSLFSGIGGLDLGLEWAGMEVIWQSEVDPYASAVLRKHWPHVPNLGDIRAIDPASVPTVDLVCGGYPCQPFSLAGKRKGSADDRNLWPIMRKVIAAGRPSWVLCENVTGHITLGLDSVLSDMESLGYACQAIVIPACAVGLRSIRNRVWILANSECSGISGRSIQATEGKATILSEKKQLARFFPPRPFPSLSVARSFRDGSRVPNGVDRNRVIGNAVSPVLACEIGCAIMAAQNMAQDDHFTSDPYPRSFSSQKRSHEQREVK